MSIDLHGYTEQEAIGKLMSALMTFEFSGEDTLEIITGKGYVLTRMVEEYLEEEMYEYTQPSNNLGTYIVFARY